MQTFVLVVASFGMGFALFKVKLGTRGGTTAGMRRWSIPGAFAPHGIVGWAHGTKGLYSRDVAGFELTGNIRRSYAVNVIMKAWLADQNGENRSRPMSWLMAETSVNTSSLLILVLLTSCTGELDIDL